MMSRQLFDGRCITLTLFLAIICSNTRLISAHGHHELHLIVGLPLEQDLDTEAAASWERGREILPGAQIAVDSINDEPDILPGHKINITVVDVGRCGVQNYYYNFLLRYINLSYQQNNNFIGAVGIFCPTAVQIIARSPGNSYSNVALTKSNLHMVVEAVNSYKLGDHLGSIMIRALLEVLEALEWRNVAAITESNDAFYSNFVENFYRTSNKRNITAVVYNYVHASNIIHQNLPRITILSVRKHPVKEILCNAYKEGMVWPKHVWILHTYHLEDFLKFNASCGVEMALENVIMLNEKVPMATQFTHLSNSSPTYSQQKTETNSYSAILYELVWSMALAINESLGDELRVTRISDIMSIQKGINVVQVRNLTEIPVAEYHSGNLTFSEPLFKVNAPSDELLIITEGGSFTYTAIFVFEITAAFTFVTVMLFCYSCFRREPEVKSTSFSLSLLVFLGCYFMFVYLSILVYFHQPWSTSTETLNGLCISLNWFSGLGISSGLLLTTALVKIFRVCYIFTKRSPKKLSARCSDTYLALYVALLLLPMMFIHTLWTIVDPYLGVLKVSSELNIVRIQKECSSKYAILWYTLLTAYMSAIFITLLIVAMKMRKIQKSNFRDTKEVTILVIAYFADIISTITFWRILYTNVNAYYAAIVLHIGHITPILLCQMLLFAPKVLPPLARYVRERKRQPSTKCK